MSLIIEAIYESGALKPLAPLPELKEHERVRLTLERSNVADDVMLTLQRSYEYVGNHFVRRSASQPASFD